MYLHMSTGLDADSVTIDDDVRSGSSEESEFYDSLSAACATDAAAPQESAAKLFAAQWRHPSMTIHRIDVSTGKHHNSVIPATVKAVVSLRIVPDQELDVITASFESHIRSIFGDLGSRNTLTVSDLRLRA